jgi:hypothetical protein
MGDPQTWVANYKRELAESLIRAGITDEAGMRVGLSRLKALKRDFLPNPDADAIRWRQMRAWVQRNIKAPAQPETAG